MPSTSTSRRSLSRDRRSSTPDRVSTRHSPEPPSPVHGSAMLAAVLAITFLTFFPVLGHQFSNWDDPQNVASNPLVLSPSWKGLAHVWLQPVNNMYAPLVFTSFMLDSLLGAGAAGVFHFTNLLLHLGSTAAVFFILRLLLRASGPAATPSSVPSSLAAAGGALLFAVHPLQAEAVAWVTGRKDVLAGCLALVAVALHLAAGEAPGRRRSVLLTGTAAAVFALALLAKATVAALPPAVLALEVLVAGRPWKQSALRLLPWFVTGAAAGWIAMAAEPKPEWLAAAVAPERRPLLAGYALLSYAGKVIWPASLAPVYSVNAPEAAGSSWSYVGLVIALLALGAAAYYRGRPAAVFALFLFPLLPVLGFVPFLYQQISMTADRYTYLSLLAVAVTGSFLLERMWPRERLRRGTVGAMAAVLAVFCLMSNRQVRIWKDAETLWAHAVRVSPGVPEAHTNLAFALHHRGEVAGAERQLELAVKADAGFHEAWNLLGLLRLERAGPDAALSALTETVRILEARGYRDKRLADAWNNLGVARMQKKDHGSAEAAFRSSLEILPGGGEAWANLAETLEAQGRRGEARQAQRKAAGRGIPLTR